MNIRMGWVIILTMISISLSAQQPPVVHFDSGDKVFVDNVDDFVASPDITDVDITDGLYYRYVQFNSIPTLDQQSSFTSSGIRIIEYLPDNAYLVGIPATYNVNQFLEFDVRSIVRSDIEDKLDQRLIEGSWPEWADAPGGQIKVMLKAYPFVSRSTFLENLSEAGVTYEKSDIHFPFVFTEILSAEFLSIASLPFVQYVEIGPDPGEPEDDGGRNLQRANVINNMLPGGLRYDATGINVLVRDDGVVGPHIDFQGRMFDFTGGANNGTHGDGVAGVMAGAGNLDPTVAGSASGAGVYVTNYESTFTDNTIDLHVNENVVITNSSYSNGCNAGYTTTTQRVDQQMIDHPNLMHVFSGGNSNNNNCGYGAGTQWGNVTGGHKVGKNVMATANLFADGTLVNSSSRGPAHDGRIKPDISAHGQNERSTSTNNTYQTFGGTSSAAPTMAGSYAQLYQAYKDLNGGSEPNTGFLKAVVLNSAFDKGNVGPDFKFGWGRIDAYQGLQILQNSTYLSSTISQGGSNNHNITIPAGVAEARMMVYWVDPAAAVNTNKALVNDLNMHVDDPSSAQHNPWILDPTPNPVNLDLPATRGIDNLNNMEQVLITSPAAGVHTVTVAGTAVPMGVQEYYLVWSFFYNEVKVTYPLGGEGLVPGENIRIHWDAFGTGGTFDIALSTNNGTSWSNIATGVSGAARLASWTVPANVTADGLIRVTRGGQSDVSDANFSIIALPNNLNFTNQCNTGMTFNWNAVSGADEYNVYQLGPKYMDLVGTTSSLSYDFNDLAPSETHWFSVQAINDQGAIGRRADAVSYFTNPAFNSCRNTARLEKTVDLTEANAGDTLEYTITFTSFFDNPITGISITDILDPAWTYIDNSLSCGTINGDVITIDSSVVAPDGVITCTFQVRSDLYSASELLFEDDIEGGAGNWTIENPTGAATWSLSTASPNSPATSWFSPNAGNENNTQYIRLLPVVLGDASELSFYHLYDTESGWDGGFVEISVDNGANWTDLGPFMTKNGYNGGLGNGSNPDVANRSAFTGNSLGYIQTMVDLSSFGSVSALIRFGFGEDDNTFSVGWYVDDVEISNIFRQKNVACVTFDQATETLCADAATVMLPCQVNCDGCINGIQDGQETGIDCGGPNCDPCPCSQSGDTLTYVDHTFVDTTRERINMVIDMSGDMNAVANSLTELRAGSEVIIQDSITLDQTSYLTISIEDCEEIPAATHNGNQLKRKK